MIDENVKGVKYLLPLSGKCVGNDDDDVRTNKLQPIYIVTYSAPSPLPPCTLTVASVILLLLAPPTRFYAKSSLGFWIIHAVLFSHLFLYGFASPPPRHIPQRFYIPIKPERWIFVRLLKKKKVMSGAELGRELHIHRPSLDWGRGSYCENCSRWRRIFSSWLAHPSTV